MCRKWGNVCRRKRGILMEEREQGSGNERWSAAIANLAEISNNLDSLGNLLIKKAVYVDEDTFNKASLASDQARNIKVLEQRVETLERELDAAISMEERAVILDKDELSKKTMSSPRKPQFSV